MYYEAELPYKMALNPIAIAAGQGDDTIVLATNHNLNYF